MRERPQFLCIFGYMDPLLSQYGNGPRLLSTGGQFTVRVFGI